MHPVRHKLNTTNSQEGMDLPLYKYGHQLSRTASVYIPTATSTNFCHCHTAFALQDQPTHAGPFPDLRTMRQVWWLPHNTSPHLHPARTQPSVRFEPAIPAIERPQSYALDRTATDTRACIPATMTDGRTLFPLLLTHRCHESYVDLLKFKTNFISLFVFIGHVL